MNTSRTSDFVFSASNDPTIVLPECKSPELSHRMNRQSTEPLSCCDCISSDYSSQVAIDRDRTDVAASRIDLSDGCKSIASGRCTANGGRCDCCSSRCRDCRQVDRSKLLLTHVRTGYRASIEREHAVRHCGVRQDGLRKRNGDVIAIDVLISDLRCADESRQQSTAFQLIPGRQRLRPTTAIRLARTNDRIPRCTQCLVQRTHFTSHYV